MATAELLQLDFGLIADLIAAHARERPEALAIVDGDHMASYRQFDDLVDRVAARLQLASIAPTQTVAICAASSMEYVAVFLGALRAGVAVAPLAPSATPDQLVRMLADCEARLVFVDKGVADRLAPVAADILAPQVV